MEKTVFKNSDINVNKLGLGSWAIGGPWTDGDRALGWGDVNDAESIAAIRYAIDLGIHYIDTANIYGAGHSEEVIGQAVKGLRDKVYISTKAGILCDTEKKCTVGEIKTPVEIKKSCEESLTRLQTDYIDLLFLHLGACEEEMAYGIRAVMEDLVQEGKIRSYGWSTEDLRCAGIFAEGKNCSAIMHIENIFEDYGDIITLCEEKNLRSICRSPLCMGLLTGKYNNSTVFSSNDLRGKNAPAWMNYFIDGKPNPELIKKLESVKEVLTSNGRSLAQGCISWIWARSENNIPVPGFRSVKQVEDNAKALEFGPLTDSQMKEISDILQ